MKGGAPWLVDRRQDASYAEWRVVKLSLFVGAEVFALVLAIQAQSSAPAAKTEALAAAARRGDAKAVAQLLDEGVDVNTKFRYGATALSYAADHGRLEVVKILIARGAEVNVEDTFYHATPLTWASNSAQTRKAEHAEIVRILLKAGATGIDAALRSAVSEQDVPMTKVIIDHGGVSAGGLTAALELAAKANAVELVSLLQAAGAKPKGQ
jgi:ankyrin repeat protein